ncbi:hypothetical protein AAMO2058_001750400 [Amorphochlora amoebiformis]
MIIGSGAFGAFTGATFGGILHRPIHFIFRTRFKRLRTDDYFGTLAAIIGLLTMIPATIMATIFVNGAYDLYMKRKALLEEQVRQISETQNPSLQSGGTKMEISEKSVGLESSGNVPQVKEKGEKKKESWIVDDWVDISGGKSEEPS